MSRAGFWSRVDTSGDCWLWTGSRTTAGYGNLRIGPGQWDYAHRVAYTERVGPIPEGLVLDHLCRNRACCNPEHLEAVTQQINVLRGAVARSFTGHCKSGRHPVVPPAGRTCAECEAASEAQRYALMQAAAVALGLPITQYIRIHGKSKRVSRAILKEVAA